MRWRDDPVLGRLESPSPSCWPRWEETAEALARGGATVMEMPDFHLAVLLGGRLARFQHATQGKMRRYQVRMLRDVLDGKDSPMMDGAEGLRHGRWTAATWIDAVDGLLVGRMVGIDDAVGFHETKLEHMGRAFGFAAADYEAACRAFERPAQASASGKLLLRMRPATHRRAMEAAAVRKLSLNRWIEEAILRATAGELRRM